MKMPPQLPPPRKKMARDAAQAVKRVDSLVTTSAYRFSWNVAVADSTPHICVEPQNLAAAYLVATHGPPAGHVSLNSCPLAAAIIGGIKNRRIRRMICVSPMAPTSSRWRDRKAFHCVLLRTK